MWVWNNFRIMVASNCLGRKWRDYVIYIYAPNICLILHDFHPEGLGISLLTFPHAWFTNTVFSNSGPAWRELSDVYLSILKKNSGNVLCLVEDLCLLTLCACVSQCCLVMCAHVRMDRLEGNVCGLPCWLCSFFFERVSHWPWSLSVSLSWKATGLQESSVSSPCPLLPSLVPFALLPPLPPPLCLPSHLCPPSRVVDMCRSAYLGTRDMN